MLVGRQLGNTSPGEYEQSGYGGETARFRHNAESWGELWEEVGKKTGSQWKVEAKLDEFGLGNHELEKKLTERRKEDGARGLTFVVRRV